MIAEDAFSQFTQLPPELRLLVWHHCLPRRIAEEDIPYTLLDGRASRQACWSNRTTFRNARVPIIASVCREARQVVFANGQYQKSQDDTSLRAIWIQPRLDLAFHLNWNRRRHDAHYMVYDAYVPSYDESPLPMLIYRARWKHDMRLSLVAEVMHPFNFSHLMDDARQPSNDETSALIVPGITLFASQDGHREDTLLLDTFAGGETLYVTLLAISIHIDTYTAVQSGLFGISGDAPVQAVDLDDTSRLKNFHQLYNSDPTLKSRDPHVEKLFNMVLGQEFRAAVRSWQEESRWILQAVAWTYMRQFHPESFNGQDPSSVWRPPVPQDSLYLRMNQHVPDESQPWWEQHAAANMPKKIVPQIMVRMCDNHCYRQEMLPHEFGEVHFGEWDYKSDTTSLGI